MAVFVWCLVFSGADSVHAAYVDNGDSITDTVTGLEWQKATASGAYTWQDALDYCEDLTLPGKSDWRLPDKNELRSLVDYSRNSPAIDIVFFPDTQSLPYWSSTTLVDHTNLAWVVDFDTGIDYPGLIGGKSSSFYVRAVRGGQVGGIGSYNLTATPASYNQINLDWSPINGAAIYALYRADSEVGPFAHRVYCGGDTSHADKESTLAPSTTYYYKVMSGDATASCSSLATGWATPSSAVAATTDPMPQDKISAGGRPDMYNNHTSSDRLNIDIALAINGLPSQSLCGNGKFRIVDGKGAVVTADDEYYCNSPSFNTNFAAYNLKFRIKTVGTRSAYFENGTLQYCDTGGTCSDIENSPIGFSFYGTTFDVGKDAWKFANATWGSVKDDSDIDKYAQKIAAVLSSNKERGVFWSSVGWTKEDTYFFLIDHTTTSNGLCHGLAHSAISNFTHQNESGWWGQGGVEDWFDETHVRWDLTTNTTVPPHKPFATKIKPLYSDQFTGSWNAISAKKIMYYFVAQDPFTVNEWVGRDKKGGHFLYNQSDFTVWQELLKSGNPVGTFFEIKDRGAHQVAMTSAVIWDGHLKYMFWDNNFPKDLAVSNGTRYYTEMLIENVSNPDMSFNQSGGNHIYLKKMDDRIAYDYVLPTMGSTVFMGRDGDSQHIYNTDPTIPAAPLSLSLVKSTAVSKSPVQPKQAEAIVATGHIEVLVVGGAVTGVFNKDTGAKINLLSESEITPGQAVQFIRLGGTMYKLYLPLDGQYRIEATKESSTPLLDIYVNIPNADGTLTSIGYDDQTYLENSVENVAFFVGRGNSDTNVRRLTKGTTYAPSATETVATAVRAPMYFTCMFTSENRVALNWENPVHPNFSKVQVVRKEDSAPTAPTDGTLVYEGTAQSFTDTGVTVGKYYFYSIYAVDTAAEYSEPQTIGIDTTRGNISGYVKFGDGSGLANAKVSLNKTTGEPVNSALTNSQGYYVISNVPFDAYVVSAEHPVNRIQESPTSVVIPDTATVNFMAIPQSLLMINKGGNGTGKVTSAPAGIDCGDDCSEVYAVSASVMLTATANPEYRFSGWSGDCSGKFNPLTVTLDTNKSCIATFEKKFPWPMFLPGITWGRQ